MNEYSSLAAGTLGKRPLIRPATAGENACRGPPSPRKEGPEKSGAPAPPKAFPSPWEKKGVSPLALEQRGKQGQYFPAFFSAASMVASDSSRDSGASRSGTAP